MRCSGGSPEVPIRRKAAASEAESLTAVEVWDWPDDALEVLRNAEVEGLAEARYPLSVLLERIVLDPLTPRLVFRTGEAAGADRSTGEILASRRGPVSEPPVTH